MNDTTDPQTAEQFGSISRRYDEAVNTNDAAALGPTHTEDAFFVTHVGRFKVALPNGWRTGVRQHFNPSTRSLLDKTSPKGL